jgi:hypothetical protein
VVVPLIAMMVWMGVYPQTFLPPVGRTTARVLASTQVNVPFRVDAGRGAAALEAHNGR